MFPNKLYSPKASTSKVNINMEYEDEVNTDENVIEEYNEHNPIILNKIKPPIINIISSGGSSRSDKILNKLTIPRPSSGGTSRSDKSLSKLTIPRPRQRISEVNSNLMQPGHLTPYLQPRQMIPLSNAKCDSSSVAKPVKYNYMKDQSEIDPASLHKISSISSQDKITAINQPLQKNHSPSIASATSNQNDSIKANYYYLPSPSVYGTPTGPRHLLFTPEIVQRSPLSHDTSVDASYRSALDVTPSSDHIGVERSPSQIINNVWSRVRNPFTRHSMLEISSPIGSSPERSSHRKSCSNNCVIGWSLFATGTIVLIVSIICLALIDNTVPDHEYGIHYPIYEALYALRGQARPINSYDLNIEDVYVDVIPVNPHGIKDYTETHHLSENGPYTIFDNDHSTFWNPVIQMQNSYMSHPPGYSITVDLLHNYTMTAIRIRDFGDYNHDVTDCQLEVNKDGMWRLVFRHSALPPGHKIKEVNGFAVLGSLWKFTVLGTASGKQPWIKEIQFFGFKG